MQSLWYDRSKAISSVNFRNSSSRQLILILIKSMSSACGLISLKTLTFLWSHLLTSLACGEAHFFISSHLHADDLTFHSLWFSSLDYLNLSSSSFLSFLFSFFSSSFIFNCMRFDSWSILFFFWQTSLHAVSSESKSPVCSSISFFFVKLFYTQFWSCRCCLSSALRSFSSIWQIILCTQSARRCLHDFSRRQCQRDVLCRSDRLQWWARFFRCDESARRRRSNLIACNHAAYTSAVSASCFWTWCWIVCADRETQCFDLNSCKHDLRHASC